MTILKNEGFGAHFLATFTVRLPMKTRPQVHKRHTEVFAETTQKTKYKKSQRHLTRDGQKTNKATQHNNTKQNKQNSLGLKMLFMEATCVLIRFLATTAKMFLQGM